MGCFKLLKRATTKSPRHKDPMVSPKNSCLQARLENIDWNTKSLYRDDVETSDSGDNGFIL